MDNALFYAVNYGTQNRFFDWLMPAVTEYKNWIFVAVILIAYLLWTKPSRGAIILLIAVLAITFGDFLSHRVLKEIFARIRPCNALPDVNLLTGCSASFSFPSNHAVNSFVLASVIGFFDKKLLAPALFLAALVAFSRVYIGVHYVSDVIAGALIGVGLGYGAVYLSKKYIGKLR